MSNNALFLLIPSISYTLHMPNLGDRALHEGMTKLLLKSHQGQTINDVWNSFPNMTWRRLSAAKELPAERFANWYSHYQKIADRPAPIQQAFSDLLLVH